MTTGEMLKILESYNCQYSRDENGDGLPLVDLLSPFDSIKEGKDELLLLAEHIACKWGLDE